MKTANIKKVVELQGKILKLKDRIDKDVRRHNEMVIGRNSSMTISLCRRTSLSILSLSLRIFPCNSTTFLILPVFIGP